MKLIPLTQGKFAMVDDTDFDFLNQWKWYAKKSGKTFYATRNLSVIGGKQKTVKMHRLILGISDQTTLCDHQDGNGLNNQRENIRACKTSENQRNRGAQSNNTSGFKGVVFHKMHNKFQAKIQIDGRRHHLGYFLCPIEAAKSYDAAAKINYGEFAKLNFP